jgi:hypothetical protein
MAIQRRRTYTPVEVDRILRASEVRASRKSEATGHTGQRHVLITNAGLATRADGFRTDTPLACAFAGSTDAARAVAEALNSAEGQAALQYLDDTYPTGIRAVLEARVVPVRVRYSSGMDIVRKAAVPCVCVVLERIEDVNCHGIHVQTAYPILAFRRGRPAWQDNTGAWH